LLQIEAQKALSKSTESKSISTQERRFIFLFISNSVSTEILFQVKWLRYLILKIEIVLPKKIFR